MTMTETVQDQNKAITVLLNGTHAAINNVIPITHRTEKPELQKREFPLTYGVLIGITGDIGGKLVLTGHPDTFKIIGETMFGMPLGDDMLASFSGELGNMIAGGLSTFISENHTHVNITAPTLLQGQTTLSGYKLAIKVTTVFDQAGDLSLFLMLD
ncbi:chemotaxis protein CheX [Lentibacillus saliphilus]|uniref:chemotaxis protein CheX n=1 Tax=Lentibacillus saliphilus TaxID=2737028 RepID=UPI001FE691DF|nr:chemotaxis protein CheX [Lentibacillus saliphilus]